MPDSAFPLTIRLSQVMGPAEAMAAMGDDREMSPTAIFTSASGPSIVNFKYMLVLASSTLVNVMLLVRFIQTPSALTCDGPTLVRTLQMLIPFESM
jgi:hypothetical protein